MMTDKERRKGTLNDNELIVFTVAGRRLYRQSRGCDFLLDGGVPFEVKHNILTKTQAEDMIQSFDRGENPVLAIIDDDGTKLLTFRLETIEDIDPDHLRKTILGLYEKGLNYMEIGMTLHYPMTKIKRILRDVPKTEIIK